MYRLTYENLARIARVNTPYRKHQKYGDMVRYPLFRRKDNTKYIAERMENGVLVYDIYYGTTWKKIDLTKEQFEALPKSQQARCGSNQHAVDMGYQDTLEYYHYEYPLNRIAISRPDGTLEICAENLCQGTRMVFNQCSSGYMKTSSKHGGVIYSWGDNVIPIFKGIRFYQDSAHGGIQMHESSRYEVVTRKVNRTAGKNVMAMYQRFLKVSETMFKAFDYDGFRDALMDEVKPFGQVSNRWHIAKDDKRFTDAAITKIDDDPVGASMLFMLAFDTLYARQLALNGRMWREISDDFVEAHFAAMRRSFSKWIYKANPDVFESTVHSHEKSYFPSCEWGCEVVVNGNAVETY